MNNMPIISDYEKLKSDKAYRENERRKSEVGMFVCGLVVLPSWFIVLMSDSASLLFVLLPMFIWFCCVAGQNPFQAACSIAEGFIDGFKTTKKIIHEQFKRSN
jgi:hypothetical protein